MSIPKSVGDDPSFETITSSGEWVEIASDINYCKMKNSSPSTQTIYITYVGTGNDAPESLESQPYWQLGSMYLNEEMEFEDSTTSRDVYAWATTEDCVIEMET